MGCVASGGGKSRAAWLEYGCGWRSTCRMRALEHEAAMRDLRDQRSG